MEAKQYVPVLRNVYDSNGEIARNPDGSPQQTLDTSDRGWYIYGTSQEDGAEYVYVATDVDDDGANNRLIKKVLASNLERAEALESDIEQKRRDGEIGKLAIGNLFTDVSEGIPARSNEMSGPGEGVLLEGLSSCDIDVLNNFAFHDANKRSAQRGGYGDESMYHSTEMGRALKEMPGVAKERAEQYAKARFGSDDVAF